MKNLKRIFSLALAGTMLAGMLTVGASAADFTDADDINNVEAVDTMVALNIINGKDDGSFDPEATVTRAEMAKMITIMLNGGSEPALTASAANPKFTDIGGHWAQKYIEYCVSQGVINGKGDGTFAPDATVTGTEAAKMALTALGYNSDVFNFTGIDWEINVNAAANAPAANLYEGLRTINPAAGLSRDNAARMLYNALDANTVEIGYDISSNGVTTNYKISDTKTMMTERFGAIKVEGIVTGNEIATIGAATAEDEGETAIKITSVENDNALKFEVADDITVGVSTDTDVLGRTVSVYLKNAKAVNGVYQIMGNVVLTGADKVVTKTTGIKDNAAWNKLADDNKLTRFTGSLATKTYKNYGTAGAYTPVAGDTTIVIDNDGDKTVDYIFVVTYDLAQINKINEKTEKVSFKGLSTKDFENVIGYEDFEEDDYVLVNTFAGKYYLTAPETVEGELEEYKASDDVATKLTVAGTTYDVSAVEVATATELTSAKTLGEDDLETEAVFYLDANGKIVAMGDAVEAASQYAISWGGASGNKIDSNRIKLTTEDGKTDIYTIDSGSTLKIANGQNENGGNFTGDGITDANKNAVGTLVSYTVRSNGNIRLELAGEAADSVNFEKGKTLIGNVASTSSTLFFHVETEENSDDIKDVKVYTGYKNAPSVKDSDATVATSEKTGKAVAVAFVDPDAGDDKTKVADHLYLKSTGTSNKNYTNATVVLAGSEEEVSVKLDADTSKTKGIYLFTINSDGYYELTAPVTTGDNADKWYKAGTLTTTSADTVAIGTAEYLLTSNTVEYDATEDGDGIVEEGAEVKMVVDSETDEVLMIVVTAAAPDCDHSAAATHHEAVDATCTAAGTIEYWECPTCGTKWNNADKADEHIITDIAGDPATGHSFAAADTADTDAGIEVGDHVCSACGVHHTPTWEGGDSATTGAKCTATGCDLTKQ